MFAAFEWETGVGLKLNHNVGVDEAHELVGEDPTSIRAFVGYAGWSAGQLEAEMKEKAWILQQPTREALTPDRCRSFGLRSCAVSDHGTKCLPRRRMIHR